MLWSVWPQLEGDEVEDLPGEHVSEEQFTDEHGNIVTKKIVRKVVRRGKGSGSEGVQEVLVEGSLQEAEELEQEAEQLMHYAVLGQESKDMTSTPKPSLIDT
ncbi:hypothetical protein GJAV_G00036190 [Gymnothorax javanicus]|nr:hypothetical protein GJAV_G00036190 [Gymnothorax javanicus]